MAPEQGERRSETLDDVDLHGQSLRHWIDWLSFDDGATPGSRYGRNGADCSYWAVACECIYVDACGDDHEGEDALNYYQGRVVNDSDDVLELVRSHWNAVPDVLKPYLDYEDNGLNMNQQAALASLSERYRVRYDADHYIVNPLDSFMMPGWAEGWVGGTNTTIYVGCSPEGEVHS